MIKILQRITVYEQEYWKYPTIDFITPLSDREKNIKKLYDRLQYAYHRFNPSITSTLWDEVLEYKEDLHQISPEVIDFVKNSIQNWASISTIKTKEDVARQFIKITELLESLLILLYLELDS